MARFDRYILSQLLGVFGFFALVLVGLHWVNHAVHLFENLIGDGQTAWVFAQMSLLMLPYVISIVLPIATFVAAIYVGNRLMGESELVVMQATGLSGMRMMRPVLYFGLIVMVMLMILMHVLVPLSKTATNNRTAEIRENITARFLKDGQFIHPTPGVTIYIRQISEQGELLDLYLQDDREPDARMSFTAKRALIARSDTGPKLLMFDGTVQRLSRSNADLGLARFGDFTFDLQGMIDKVERDSLGLDEVASIKLWTQDPEALKKTNVGIAAFQREFHYRTAQPLLAFSGAMIGFAAILIGSFSRFGLWKQVSIAVAMAIVVQATNSVGLNLAQNGGAYGWLWLYAAPVTGCLIGLILVLYSQAPKRLQKRGGA